MKDYIEEIAIDYNVALSDHFLIDEINVLQATISAMHQAIDGLNVQPEYILVDGNYFHPYQDIPHQCIPNGDDRYDSIAAASILAKVFHDQLIGRLCDQHPELDEYYHLRNNMGYGTQQHLQGLEEYGLSQFHRKSFGPCKKICMITENLDH